VVTAAAAIVIAGVAATGAATGVDAAAMTAGRAATDAAHRI
jgi:hypothetical protein